MSERGERKAFMQGTYSGWDSLRIGDYEAAVREFHRSIDEQGGDFSDFWGLGKASFFLVYEQGNAELYLKKAFDLALQEWKGGGIPYDIVEAIEKDLNRVQGGSGDRVLQRGRDYVFAFLCLTGAMPLAEAVAGVERMANLKLLPWWDRLVEAVEKDERLRLLGREIVHLPEVRDPAGLLKARERYRVTLTFSMDDLGRALHLDLWREVREALEPILNSFSGGNLKSETVIRMALNSRTFSEFLQEIELATRLHDLRYVISNWYRVLYNLWVQMPRWELGFRSLADLDTEDLMLGEVKVEDVARILGLVADENGNLFCPHCGEKVALADAHHHV